jgi:fatty acid synthase subunit beta
MVLVCCNYGHRLLDAVANVMQSPPEVKGSFARTILSAGDHVKLAGGEHYDVLAFRSKIAEIQLEIRPVLDSHFPPSTSIRGNSYSNPLSCEMEKERSLAEGFGVAAAIPSDEETMDVLRGWYQTYCVQTGLRRGIRLVVTTAAAYPGFALIPRWTSGQTGGHGLCEDFHQPVLAT